MGQRGCLLLAPASRAESKRKQPAATSSLVELSSLMEGHPDEQPGWRPRPPMVQTLKGSAKSDRTTVQLQVGWAGWGRLGQGPPSRPVSLPSSAGGIAAHRPLMPPAAAAPPATAPPPIPAAPRATAQPPIPATQPAPIAAEVHDAEQGPPSQPSSTGTSPASNPLSYPTELTESCGSVPEGPTTATAHASGLPPATCTDFAASQHAPTHHTTAAAAAVPSPPPSPDAPSLPVAQPQPTGPNGELEYAVEAFVARRTVDSCLQYLVKCQGYELLGEEPAYSWQWASVLAECMDQGSYRRMVQGWRQAQPAGASNSTSASRRSSNTGRSSRGRQGAQQGAAGPQPAAADGQ